MPYLPSTWSGSENPLKEIHFGCLILLKCSNFLTHSLPLFGPLAQAVMGAELNIEKLLSQILQDTLQEISSPATEAKTKCCVICLGDLVEQCEAQPCRHKNFDYLCLVAWLEIRATCPLCRSDVTEVRYDLSTDGKHQKVFKVTDSLNQGDEAGLDEAASAPRQAGLVSITRPNRPARPPQYEDEAVRRRRLIYQKELYSFHVGSNNPRPAQSRYQELSPQLFVTDPALVSRARMWLRRELRVFQFPSANDNDDLSPLHNLPRRRWPCTTESLLEYIIDILKSVDMQGSAGQVEEMIQMFLGRDHSRLFLHELRAWLRSPCRSLREWDCSGQYRYRSPFGPADTRE